MANVSASDISASGGKPRAGAARHSERRRADAAPQADILIGALSMPLFLGSWEVSRSGIVNIVLFPPPSIVAVPCSNG